MNVECDADKIRLIVDTAGDFNGRIYPKGFSKAPECGSVYSQEESPVRMNLTFSLLGECGMLMERGDSKTTFTSVVVVQPHSKLVTMMGSYPLEWSSFSRIIDKLQYLTNGATHADDCSCRTGALPPPRQGPGYGATIFPPYRKKRRKMSHACMRGGGKRLRFRDASPKRNS